MMHQEKECLDFIEKAVKDPYKVKILAVLNKLKDFAKDKNFECPTVGKFPEDSERWSLWWKDSRSHISIDFYPTEEKDIFFYYRKKNSLTSLGSDESIAEIPDSFLELILDIKPQQGESDNV